jgi:hypothetical protein
MRTIANVFGYIASAPIVVGSGAISGGIAYDHGYNCIIVYGVAYLSCGLAIAACSVVYVIIRG